MSIKQLELANTIPTKRAINARVTTVTKELAEYYLNNNGINRPLYSPAVNSYAEQMANNEWRLNGEPIIISDNDKLLDGQHRLSAVALSGVHVKMLFVHGVDESTFDSIDIGKHRNGSDVLIIEANKSGEKITPRFAATLATCIRFDLTMAEVGTAFGSTATSLNITPYVVNNANKDNPDYHSAASFIMEYNHDAPPLSRGMLAFLLYRFRKLDNVFGFADDWMTGFITGANLDGDDSRLFIRERIYRETRSATKTPMKFKAGYTIKAWHHAAHGKLTLHKTTILKDPISAYMHIAFPTDRKITRRKREVQRKS